MYTARRDDMLRALSEQCDTAAQLVEAELAAMDLPHALKAVGETQIPERLQARTSPARCGHPVTAAPRSLPAALHPHPPTPAGAPASSRC